MTTIKLEQYEHLSKTTKKVFLNNTPLSPFSLQLGYITAATKGLYTPHFFDFPFLSCRLNSTRLITMGNEKKQQILKPSNSTPVTTKPAVEVPVLDVSVSTPIKKPEPMIKTTKTKQRKLQRREELIDIDEVERPKPLTLSEKRIRQTERTFQIKKWKVREAREEREVRSQQRKAMTKGGSKKEIIAEETQKRRHVRFDLSKNKTHLITADV